MNRELRFWTFLSSTGQWNMVPRFPDPKCHFTLTGLAVWVVVLLLAAPPVVAQVRNDKYGQRDLFRQLEEIWPTANGYRTASGAPGPAYWQQQVDYTVDVEIDDQTQTLRGKEEIRYTNRSPHSLRYLWLQLDANLFAPDSDAVLTATAPSLNRMSVEALKRLVARETFDGGARIDFVRDAQGKPLDYVIVKTMMRVELPSTLPPGGTFTFAVGWHYRINDARLIGGRTGYEYFPKDGNYLYEMAQWFPRLVAYTDYRGWQHHQYLGRGEFTLELGSYVVRITVPSDHVVAATGVLLNPDEVLTPLQRERLIQARTAKKPVFIITPDEAKVNEKSRAKTKKTWIFKADQVRDFAFASSRKFIWDAQGHDVEGNRVLAMSFYPKEGEPLWSRYSTHAIIHTLNVYSRYTFPYPYPVAISVNGPVGGMEYPMICFNGPRPEPDGTYSERTKYALISVIIHEVGHNYFPMIVNSDERQWTWMDEGINTFLQYLSEQEWEDGYPSRRGEPKLIVGYMRSRNQVPIMTQSDSILQFGNNAYAKPATALNILRETILGRELFDYAFKEYARRWRFKRPTPADFFRTMEDASGVDLDWFWRGWFYTTDHVDLSVENLHIYTIDKGDPDEKAQWRREEKKAQPETLSQKRNRALPKRTDQFPELKDFYDKLEKDRVTDEERAAYRRFLERLTPEERKLLQQRRFFHIVEIKNVGGLVMPVILELEFENGKKEEVRIPAEIWRRDNRTVRKLLIRDQPIRSIVLDPHLETADVDRTNNYFPRRPIRSRFQVFKEKKRAQNAMQKARAKEAKKKPPKPAASGEKAAKKKESG